MRDAQQRSAQRPSPMILVSSETRPISTHPTTVEPSHVAPAISPSSSLSLEDIESHLVQGDTPHVVEDTLFLPEAIVGDCNDQSHMSHSAPPPQPALPPTPPDSSLLLNEEARHAALETVLNARKRNDLRRMYARDTDDVEEALQMASLMYVNVAV